MTPPEFSRPLLLDRIGAGLTRTVEANEAERQALATRLGLPAIELLSVTFHLSPPARATVAATGLLSARVTQECIVSGEPVEAALNEAFAVRFVPEGRESDDLSDPDSPDDVAYTDGVIDLGEAATEQLALMLDPYPRKPDAVLPDELAAGAESPFAALARRPN